MKDRLILLFTAISFIGWVVCAFIISTSAWSFPEMVRHGYVNCATCHTSPNGGGILTPYGRGLSAEALSTFREEGEERFLYAVTPPEWVSFGGDIRGLQTSVKTPEAFDAKYLLMQADLEVAIGTPKLQAVGTIGVDPRFRRHYLLYRPTESIALRVGKFMPAFGINTPDHVQVTKRGLGFGENTESYNLEGSFVNTNFEVFATGILGREKGFALRASYALFERFKVGASYFYGVGKVARQVAGPYVILGIFKSLVLLGECDFSFVKGDSLINEYAKLDWEPYRGVHLFLTQERATDTETYGAGLQLFPRPHWELSLTISESVIYERETKAAYAMAHFYL